MSKLPLHLQSIMHIINNYDFVYADNYVTASVNVYVDQQELKDLRETFQIKLNTPDDPVAPMSDEDRKGFIDAITDINLAISELEAANGRNNQ